MTEEASIDLFGPSLRDLRRHAHLSQRALAERVEIDFTYLSKIENQRVEPPSEAVIRKIAHELATALGRDETELGDRLTVLAGKVPSDLAALLHQHSFVLSDLRRSLTGDIRSREDWLRRLQGDSQ